MEESNVYRKVVRKERKTNNNKSQFLSVLHWMRSEFHRGHLKVLCFELCFLYMLHVSCYHWPGSLPKLRTETCHNLCRVYWNKVALKVIKYYLYRITVSHITNQRDVIVLKKSYAFHSQVSPVAAQYVPAVSYENKRDGIYCAIIQSWLQAATHAYTNKHRSEVTHIFTTILTGILYSRGTNTMTHTSRVPPD